MEPRSPLPLAGNGEEVEALAKFLNAWSTWMVSVTT